MEPASCGLDELGHPEGFLTGQVEGWQRRWERSKHEENPLADEIADWLADAMPPDRDHTNAPAQRLASRQHGSGS